MLVSIIVPCYNVNKYFRKCLDSIIHLTYTNWECILYDDCSIDDTYKIAKEYALKDRRFKLYRNNLNLGCGITRRNAIEKGCGDYFAFVDADDYIDADFLEIMLNKCLETNSEIAICGTYNRNSDYSYIGLDIAEKEYITSKEELYRLYMTSSWILLYNGNKFYSKRVINSVEYSPLRFCEDSMTTYKWLWEANLAIVIPKSMYHYIRHKDSNSNNNNSELLKAVDTCICIYDHYLFCVKHKFIDIIPRLLNFILPFLNTAIRLLDLNNPNFNLICSIRDNIL